MTAHTPIFNIPVPDSTTKAYKLGDELYAMGLGVESALRAASIPPATNTYARVVPSAAARDSYFGVPTTVADQLALQTSGATAHRTDTGSSERYYAAYNATTNPGGMTAAGWYPVGAAMPIMTVSANGAAMPITGSWTQITAAWGTPDLNRGMGTFSGGNLTIAQPGVYDIAAGIYTPVNGVQSIEILLNSTVVTTGILAQAQVSGFTANVARPVKLKTGDVVRVFAAAPSSTTLGTQSYFAVAFKTPA